MKLTIWQQFSSNHSGFFWIVGEFPSYEDAKVAQAKIQELLHSIEEWRLNNVDALSKYEGKLLPPEKRAAKKYSVEWPQPLDKEGCSVNVVHNLLFSTKSSETWMTMQPIRGLIEYFGGKTIGFDIDNHSGWRDWLIRFNCDCPDEATAQQLRILPSSLKFDELSIVQDDLHLSYTFQITGDVGGLGAVLKSNGCTNIHVEIIERSKI
jgi:hypothetical protein